jgi:hypothetical protein
MKAIQIETFAAGQLHFQEANDTWLLASLLVSVSQAGRNHRNVRSFGAPDRRRRDRDAGRNHLPVRPGQRGDHKSGTERWQGAVYAEHVTSAIQHQYERRA